MLKYLKMFLEKTSTMNKKYLRSKSLNYNNYNYKLIL